MQTTGCVRGLLSGPAAYTGQSLCNTVGCCKDRMLVYDSACFRCGHVYPNPTKPMDWFNSCPWEIVHKMQNLQWTVYTGKTQLDSLSDWFC